MNDLFEGNASLADSDAQETLDAPKAPPRKLNLGNDKDRAEYFKQLKNKAIKNLYKNDPLVRQGIDAQLAVEAAKTSSSAKNDNVKYDESGKVTGVSNSVVSGVHATSKNQIALMQALRADINKRYGII